MSVAVCALAVLVIRGISVTNATDSTTVTNKTKTTTQTVTASSTTTPQTTSAITAALVAAWSNIAKTRAGDIDIAVYNHTNGETAHYINAAGTLNTASIVKLALAEEVLLQSQNTGTTLTNSQLTNLTTMLENSDNTAASTLWTEVGGAAAMNSFFKQVGASSSVAAKNGLWGLTQTSALDQLAVLNTLAYPGKLLTTHSATIINNLLDNVEPDQMWGVSAGLVGSADFKLKNGWLQDSETHDAYSNTNSWTVNSVGHVTANNVDYTIAVLTDGQTTEDYGIETIESLSTETWKILNE